MSRTITNRDIFSVLHNQGSNPKSSNPNYISDVEAHLWNCLEGRRECEILIKFVKDISKDFSDYAKRIYPASGYSARNILSGTKHTSWLDTTIEFPSIVDCLCPGCQPKDENEEVNTNTFSCMKILS